MPIIVTTTAPAPPPVTSGTPAGVGVTTVISRIQTQLEDPGGNRFDAAYILSFIQPNWEDICSELSAYDLSFDDKVIELPAVPGNTKDLGSYQSAGQPLQYMIQPMALQWKNVGEDDSMYDGRNIPRVDKVMDRNLASGAIGIANYEFRDGIVFISPSSQAVDLRIKFQSAPSAIDDETDTIIQGTTNILVYKTAAQIASRNDKPELAQAIAFDLHNARENFEELMVKQTQGQVRRFGRMNRRPTSLQWKIPTI